MRHGKKFNHLGRKSAHRKALLRHLATSLILHKRIKTTVAKAKALRTFVEPIITKAKEDTTHSRRMAYKYLQNKEAVKELFREVNTKVGDRPGGYTRIIKLGNRLGDGAEICYIELVDFNETYVKEKSTKKRRVRRGGGKKKTTEGKAATQVNEQPSAETKTAEEPKAEEKPEEGKSNEE
jgi:large subunit ribosomal protein L17